MKWRFSNKRFSFALKVVFGQYPSLPAFPQCRNRRSECLQTSTKGVTLTGTSETSCGWCGSWATKNEPYQTLPFAPLIQTNLWVCWWKERRRKASTGHRSMDLQWLLTCFNKYEQDAPPLHNNPAFKTHPISFPSLADWRNPCWEHKGKSIYTIGSFGCVWYEGRRRWSQQWRNKGESSLMNQLYGPRKGELLGLLAVPAEQKRFPPLPFCEE